MRNKYVQCDGEALLKVDLMSHPNEYSLLKSAEKAQNAPLQNVVMVHYHHVAQPSLRCKKALKVLTAIFYEQIRKC